MGTLSKKHNQHMWRRGSPIEAWSRNEQMGRETQVILAKWTQRTATNCWGAPFHLASPAMFALAHKAIASEKMVKALIPKLAPDSKEHFWLRVYTMILRSSLCYMCGSFCYSSLLKGQLLCSVEWQCGPKKANDLYGKGKYAYERIHFKAL